MTSVLDTVKNNNARILKILTQVPRALNQNEVILGLFHASKNGFAECVECLLESALVDPNIKDASGNTALHLACSSNSCKTVDLLVRNSSNVNALGTGRATPLHIASRLGYDYCVESLLKSDNIDVNVKDSGGNTPLIYSVKNSNYIVMRRLLDAKCDLNLTDKLGRSALHYASQKAQCVKILLEAGASTNIRDTDNNTPLLFAAFEGFDKVVKLLCAANCDVNVKSNTLNKTALHILSYKGHADCIEDLVQAGADINLYDAQYHTPLWYAISNKKPDVVKLLLRANSQVDTFQCSENIPTEACPTRFALSKGFMNVIKLFILTGYDKKHLKQCLSERELADQFLENDDIEHWFNHAHGVLTLKQSCRQSIRHHLGCYLFHDLNDLPIPDAMKDYISLRELDHH